MQGMKYIFSLKQERTRVFAIKMGSIRLTLPQMQVCLCSLDTDNSDKIAQ